MICLHQKQSTSIMYLWLRPGYKFHLNKFHQNKTGWDLVTKCKGTPSRFPGTKVKNGRVWAPNAGGRSPHHEAHSGAWMLDKMVQKKWLRLVTWLLQQGLVVLVRISCVKKDQLGQLCYSLDLVSVEFSPVRYDSYSYTLGTYLFV